ncbi:hypothetical protein [Wolbachia endosymbiont (group B) of Limnophora tigrina]|uniref:hypothetical protein n=1 Tax=Wolbachia endosymbiont (group B) of Limnophora tigrina TaxID=3139317 RepID=UPI0035B55FD5
MNKAVANGYEEVVDLNNNSDGLGKVESIVTLEEEEEFFDAVERQEPLANFNIPLSIFHYKDYNSDFFTSWYNISSEIFKEINRACPEKKVLNSALSVLMFPYIVFTALGLAVYNRLKTNDKTQISSEENKTKKSEVSESTTKRLAYGVLAAIVILVNIAVLVALIIPATLALATFYLLNRELSHSLVAALKISMGQYSNEHQNIEVSFHETEVSRPNIVWYMEIKFPPQFEQLLKDLYEDKNDSWVDIRQDSKHNTILKLSANIHLKNGLRPLRNEIKNVLATSIQEFAKTMEELMKLEKKDITYDKLKELLNEFRLKVVSSIDSKLTSHLIYNAYQAAFIQAIKFAQKRREKKGGFLLEKRPKEVLVEQELKSQGKELPSEKETIIKDLKELKKKEAFNLTDEDDRLEALVKISDNAFPVFKAKWKKLIREGKIAEKTVIDIYNDTHPQETEKALDNAEREIKDLREIGQKRYNGVCEKLKEIHGDIGKSNLTDGILRRKLEDLFKLELTDQAVYQRLIKSVMKKAKVVLNQSDLTIDIRQSLLDEFCNLNVNVCFYHKVNLLLEKMHSEITKCGIQGLFKEQEKSIKNIKDNTGIFNEENEEDEKRLVNKIVSCRKEIGEYLTQPAQLREIIEKQNKDLDVEKNSKEKESSSIKLIELCLKNNQEILKTLEQLESEKERLLINEETKNDYMEELESREKIKFAIIEDDLLKEFERETFNEEAVKKLLEEAELEYYLAEKCIKSPVIKTKNNIKHFYQGLLSPLIDNLTKDIINNIPGNKDIINNIPGNSEGCIQKVKNWSKVMFGAIKIGASNAYKETTERKALNVAHNTYKEGETFLQCFQSNYEGVGAFLGNLFSDDGVTFKNDVWPKIEEHLHGMWDRFFKDIEFKIGSKLDEVNVTQPKQETTIAA